MSEVSYVTNPMSKDKNKEPIIYDREYKDTSKNIIDDINGLL
jgi:hypothetical protein